MQIVRSPEAPASALELRRPGRPTTCRTRQGRCRGGDAVAKAAPPSRSLAIVLEGAPRSSHENSDDPRATVSASGFLA